MVYPTFFFTGWALSFEDITKKNIIQRKKTEVGHNAIVDESLSGMAHYRSFMSDLIKPNMHYGGKLGAPTLVLFGASDPFLHPPSRDEFLKDSNNFSIRILKGGHWVHETHSAQVNQLMEEFLC